MFSENYGRKVAQSWKCDASSNGRRLLAGRLQRDFDEKIIMRVVYALDAGQLVTSGPPSPNSSGSY
jgi:hypothetical protein